MRKSIIGAVLATAALAGAAQAEMTGGNVALGYSALPKEDEYSKYSLGGSVDFGIGTNAGVQLDLSAHDLDELDETGINGGLHGFYDMGYNGTVGGFIAHDGFQSKSIDYVGGEFAQSTGAAEMQGYLGWGEGRGIGGVIAGGEVMVPLSGALSGGASVDYAYLDRDYQATKVGLKADYDMNGTHFYGELGHYKGQSFGSENDTAYVGLGLTYDLGYDRKGAKFGDRGLLSMVPGF